MTASANDVRASYKRFGRVAQSLSEMGVEPEGLEGQYYTVDDALYRDETGWYVLVRPNNNSDGEGRLYFDLETDGNRIEWK
jgi:hypothetical protein